MSNRHTETTVKIFDVQWCEVDDHFICQISGTIERCVSCNRPLEYRLLPAGEPGPCYHQCPTRHENRRAAQARRDCDYYEHDHSSWSDRLEEGVRMMHADCD